MTTEQKAKRYGETLDRAKKELDACGSQDYDAARLIFRLFPELKESEDEKIRKALIKFVKVNIPDEERYIAWLEKQGEKKSDPRYSILDKLIEADNIYQMSVNDAMVEEAKNKAIEALSELEISKLLELEKQGKNKSIDDLTAQEAMDIAVAKCFEQGKSALEAIKEEKVDNQNCIKSYAQEHIGDKVEPKDYSNIDPYFFKPADKVEPKFKVGDWVVRGKTIAQILDIQEQYYIGLDINGNDFISSRFLSDDKIHLWTIKDAKDGDVLSDGTTIFIFKDLLSDGSVMSYCDYDKDSGESDSFCPLSVNLICSKITTATREQRDTLMKAMADAGYTFDFEKKELKKVEQKKDMNNKLTDFETSLKHIMEEAIECGDTHNLKADADMLLRLVQNPAWSEEDDIYIENIILAVEKQYPIAAKDIVDFLKSLKDRYTWKPSEEQLKTLQKVIDAGYYTSYPYALETLYEQLKKIKG